MNIYLVSQDVNTGYDTYDSFVCYANSEQEARELHPSSFVTHVANDKWMGTFAKGGEYENDDGYDWVPFNQINNVTVELIGEAEHHSSKPSVILASFNAG